MERDDLLVALSDWSVQLGYPGILTTLLHNGGDGKVGGVEVQLGMHSIRVPVWMDYMAPRDVILDIEETWHRESGIPDGLLDRTETWKDVEVIEVESLMSLVHGDDGSFKYRVSLEIFRRRLYV